MRIVRYYSKIIRQIAMKFKRHYMAGSAFDLKKNQKVHRLHLLKSYEVATHIFFEVD